MKKNNALEKYKILPSLTHAMLVVVFFVPTAKGQESFSSFKQELLYENTLDKYKNLSMPIKLSNPNEMQLVTPQIYKLNGKSIITPKFSTPKHLISNKSTTPFKTTKTYKFKSNQENIKNVNKYFNEGVDSIYSDLDKQIVFTNKSVAPGEINNGLSLDGLGIKVPDVIRNEVIIWKDDACNISRNIFYTKIESRFKDIFQDKRNLESPVNRRFEIARRELAVIARNFDNDCLKPYVKALNDGEISEKVKSRVVIFVKNSSVPFCSGIRINKTQVLTARHCFYNHENGFAASFTEDILNKGASPDIDVFILDSLYEIEKITSFWFNVNEYSLNEDNQSFNVKNDYIVVNLKDSNSLSDPGQISKSNLNSSAKLFEPLLLIGYYAFHNPLNVFRVPGSSVKDWRNGLRVTNGSYCRVFDISKKGVCFAHACQSLPLFSGGALIASSKTRGNQNIRVLGVHSRGGEDSAEGCIPFESNVNNQHSLVGRQGGLAVSSNWIFNN